MTILSRIELVIFCSFLCCPVCAEAPDSVEWISIINLISTPNKYHGKMVGVSGYLSVSHEASWLCLSDKVPSPKECIWVGGEGITGKKIGSEYNNMPILLKGRFDKNHRGHLGLNSGSIHNVIEILKTRWWPSSTGAAR